MVGFPTHEVASMGQEDNPTKIDCPLPLDIPMHMYSETQARQKGFHETLLHHFQKNNQTYHAWRCVSISVLAFSYICSRLIMALCPSIKQRVTTHTLIHTHTHTWHLECCKSWHRTLGQMVYLSSNGFHQLWFNIILGRKTSRTFTTATIFGCLFLNVGGCATFFPSPCNLGKRVRPDSLANSQHWCKKQVCAPRRTFMASSLLRPWLLMTVLRSSLYRELSVVKQMDSVPFGACFGLYLARAMTNVVTRTTYFGLYKQYVERDLFAKCIVFLRRGQRVRTHTHTHTHKHSERFKTWHRTFGHQL